MLDRRSTFMTLPLLLFILFHCGHGNVNLPSSDQELAKRVDRLESIVLGSDFRLSQQQDLLQKQAETIRRQTDQLHEQDQKQDQLLQKLNQQDVRLADQDRQLREQADQLRRQESLLQEQQRFLVSQEELLQQLLAQDTKQPIGDMKHTGAGPDGVGIHKDQPAMPDSIQYNDLPDIPKGRNDAIPVAQHVQGVRTRAVDSATLEVVVTQLSQEVSRMSSDLRVLQSQTASNHVGSTFVRWGSSGCGNLAELVYTGIVGGSWPNDFGAATDYLCLPLNPALANMSRPLYYALLFGAEYDTFDSHHRKGSLCSVCRTIMATSIMIPATHVCELGWHAQYSGYLMTGLPADHAGSQYICVDSDMQDNPYSLSSPNTQHGKSLYFTATQCGSLPCTPGSKPSPGQYSDNQIVTCVVCSK